MSINYIDGRGLVSCFIGYVPTDVPGIHDIPEVRAETCGVTATNQTITRAEYCYTYTLTFQ